MRNTLHLTVMALLVVNAAGCPPNAFEKNGKCECKDTDRWTAAGDACCPPNAYYNWGGNKCDCKSSDSYTGDACCPPNGQFDWGQNRCVCRDGFEWDNSAFQCKGKYKIDVSISTTEVDIGDNNLFATVWEKAFSSDGSTGTQRETSLSFSKDCCSGQSSANVFIKTENSWSGFDGRGWWEMRDLLVKAMWALTYDTTERLGYQSRFQCYWSAVPMPGPLGPAPVCNWRKEGWGHRIPKFMRVILREGNGPVLGEYKMEITTSAREGRFSCDSPIFAGAKAAIGAIPEVGKLVAGAVEVTCNLLG